MPGASRQSSAKHLRAIATLCPARSGRPWKRFWTRSAKRTRKGACRRQTNRNSRPIRSKQIKRDERPALLGRNKSQAATTDQNAISNSGLIYFGCLATDVAARQDRPLIWAGCMAAATCIYRAIKDSRNEVPAQYKSGDQQRCLGHSIHGAPISLTAASVSGSFCRAVARLSRAIQSAMA